MSWNLKDMNGSLSDEEWISNAALHFRSSLYILSWRWFYVSRKRNVWLKSRRPPSRTASGLRKLVFFTFLFIVFGRAPSRHSIHIPLRVRTNAGLEKKEIVLPTSFCHQSDCTSLFQDFCISILTEIWWIRVFHLEDQKMRSKDLHIAFFYSSPRSVR